MEHQSPKRSLNCVPPKEFKRISMCDTSKEAWEIFCVTREGTQKVKSSKLQRLITDFEIIVTQEDDSFKEFYTKSSNMVTACHKLGKVIPQDNLVKKIEITHQRFSH